MVKDPCQDCDGEGAVKVTRTVTVTIPAGVDNGMRLRLSGEGEGSGQGGERGDLYVFLEVEEHEHFQRDGADIHAPVDLSFSQAALGVELKVRTIHGSEKVSVPAGTQSGTVVRLRRQGVDHPNGRGRGDHYAALRVLVPETLTRAQKKALAELQTLGL